MPQQTSRAIIGATAAMLEAVRDIDPQIRVYASASGAMFGDAPESPQRESTPCRPTNPYAIAKLAAHQLVGSMRTHDGLFACSGIVFNHESERRTEQFVTRKITRGVAAIKLGLQNELSTRRFRRRTRLVLRWRCDGGSLADAPAATSRRLCIG